MTAASLETEKLPAARYESPIRLAEAIRTHQNPQDLFQVVVRELGNVVRFDAIAQSFEIDGEDAPVVDHQPAADHHADDRGAVLGMDELVDRIVQRQPIRVIEIEHDDVGLVAGGDPPDTVAKAERAGAALGRRQRRQPPPLRSSRTGRRQLLPGSRPHPVPRPPLRRAAGVAIPGFSRYHRELFRYSPDNRHLSTKMVS